MRRIASRVENRVEAFGQHFLLVAPDRQGRQWRFSAITSDSDRMSDGDFGASFRRNLRSIDELGYSDWLRGSVYGFDRIWHEVCRLEAVLAVFSPEDRNAI